MSTLYRIMLTPQERDELDAICKKGKHASRMVLLALVHLFCDVSPDGRGHKSNCQISRELNISERTIESTKKRFILNCI